MKTKEELEDELKDVSGGSSIPGLEAIGPYIASDNGELTPEEIQKLREISDSLKTTTQNIR